MTRGAPPWWVSLVALVLVSALVWAGLFFGSRLIRPARGLQAYGAVVPPPETATTSLVLCGDVMLARGVRDQSERMEDTAWPFRQNLFLTANADIAFANLESLFSENPDPNPAHLEFQLHYDPKSGAEVEETARAFTSLSRSLMEGGAFFSRPYGEWAAGMFERVPPETIETLRRVKRIFDPKGILKPGALCFQEVSQ